MLPTLPPRYRFSSNRSTCRVGDDHDIDSVESDFDNDDNEHHDSNMGGGGGHSRHVPIARRSRDSSPHSHALSSDVDSEALQYVSLSPALSAQSSSGLSATNRCISHMKHLSLSSRSSVQDGPRDTTANGSSAGGISISQFPTQQQQPSPQPPTIYQSPNRFASSSRTFIHQSAAATTTTMNQPPHPPSSLHSSPTSQPVVIQPQPFVTLSTTDPSASPFPTADNVAQIPSSLLPSPSKVVYPTHVRSSSSLSSSSSVSMPSSITRAPSSTTPSTATITTTTPITSTQAPSLSRTNTATIALNLPRSHISHPALIASSPQIGSSRATTSTTKTSITTDQSHHSTHPIATSTTPATAGPVTSSFFMTSSTRQMPSTPLFNPHSDHLAPRPPLSPALIPMPSGSMSGGSSAAAGGWSSPLMRTQQHPNGPSSSLSINASAIHDGCGIQTPVLDAVQRHDVHLLISLLEPESKHSSSQGHYWSQQQHQQQQPPQATQQTSFDCLSSAHSIDASPSLKTCNTTSPHPHPSPNAPPHDADGQFAIAPSAHLSISYNINETDQYGSTPLILAASHGFADCIAVLLRQPDILINSSTSHGFTALMLAAQNGHAECVQLLLQGAGIDINYLNRYNKPALMYAVQGGHDACVSLLVNHPQIDITLVDGLGKTAFMSAAFYGHAECLRAFLLRPSSTSKHSTSQQSTSSLFESSASFINAVDRDRKTALLQAASNGHTACVDLLLSHPQIAVHSVDKYDKTALMLAAEHGHSSTVTSLLNHPHVSPNRANPRGISPLMFAALGSSPSCIAVLLASPSIHINQCDVNGKTALIHACDAGCVEAVKLLLQHPDIDVSCSDEDGRTALMHAAGFPNVLQIRCAEAIISWGIHLMAIDDGNTVDCLKPGETEEEEQQQQRRQFQKRQLSHFHINQQSADGKTALMYACLHGNNFSIRQLLQVSTIDLNVKDCKHKTALMLSVSKNQSSHTEILLEHISKM